MSFFEWLKNNNKELYLEKKKWIQDAVDKKHAGFCSPMTKKTCTPRRKALAKRFKKGGDLHENDNWSPPQNAHPLPDPRKVNLIKNLINALSQRTGFKGNQLMGQVFTGEFIQGLGFDVPQLVTYGLLVQSPDGHYQLSPEAGANLGNVPNWMTGGQ